MTLADIFLASYDANDHVLNGVAGYVPLLVVDEHEP